MDALQVAHVPQVTLKGISTGVSGTFEDLLRDNPEFTEQGLALVLDQLVEDARVMLFSEDGKTLYILL